MLLTIFNGSPRGKAGNSETLIKCLMEGMKQIQMSINTYCLNKTEKHDSYIDCFKSSNMVLIVFPLYTDSMPGIVMSFIEKLKPLSKALTGLKLGFIVQSGFPEAKQSRYVEKYLQWLAGELDAEYLGTVVMGGGMGLSRKKKELFLKLGMKLAQEGRFDAELTRHIAGMERLSKPGALFFKVMAKTGLFNYYWDRALKKNNAFQDRNAKPYVE